MARKISAKTLAGLLAGYRGRFPAEFAEKAARSGAEEASVLLALLAPADAWALLRSVEARTAREWIARCDADALRRLVRYEIPDQPEPPAEELGNAAIALLTPLVGQ